MSNSDNILKQIAPYRWRIPVDYQAGMRVPGEIIASERMIPQIINDKAASQVANVATMPGIVGASMAMPDIHWGYGFPIGGVAAFDLDEGVISPGGVGYDINCGVTLLKSKLTASEIRKDIPSLVDALFAEVPCGVGSEGSIRLNNKSMNAVLERGARWLIEQGLASNDDLELMEEKGCLTNGDASLLSKRAKERALKQLGTLGSGNHFLEIQVVEEIFDKTAADAFGLFKGQTVVMIHSGSRGLGHQVCDDSLKKMQDAVRRYGLELPDRQLACTPIKSREGEEYLSAMKCAANFAWANRLAMVGLIRSVFNDFYRKSILNPDLSMLWDVCHNIAKIENFEIEGKNRALCVHRKGATRSVGPGDASLPPKYRHIGQPVLIPGDMGRASYVLVGTEEARRTSFSSACHGAGRVLSRKAAVRATKNTNIRHSLAKRGIVVRSQGKWTLNEEVPEAYKDVDDVVEAVHGAGISLKVARLKPMGTVKG
ncbi:RtcB family protein [bacterium]|nr:RtcB family protein [bacterium]